MTVLEQGIHDAAETLRSLGAFQTELDRAAALVGKTLVGGGKLLVCGNGGSAGDGADFATEFACRFKEDRRPYPALNLAACGSLLTATGNDYGFEEVFARSVRAFGAPGDVLFALSTSGASKNITAALHAARNGGLSSVALLGREGGVARGLADIEFVITSQITARIQEAHRFLLHILCEMVDSEWLLPAEKAPQSTS
ncbi:MAG TPA: SIS domain-containing protein [Chthoniobacteraceae bacterium]|nr:phosphoheptose isomerase [Chthoniobacter sp.]HEV7868358.1 SIS domain-containing protein [Chthoniobacteraceae bacterium]